jgi:GxxExxY protein
MSNLKFEEESFKIRGAIFDVYGEMGCGYVEPVYQECMERELKLRAIPFSAQRELVIRYKGEPLNQLYKPDLMCFDCIVVELKAVRELAKEHFAQVHNYLKAAGLELGFLVNFGHHPGVQIERIVR